MYSGASNIYTLPVSATWVQNREQRPRAGQASPPPAVAKRRPQVGKRTELARYTVPAGERILYGQRVEGVVRLTDRHASPGGRNYLVERGLESKREPDGLVSDDLAQAESSPPYR